MTAIERYRTWYEHERWANEAMLKMIDSVPSEARSDLRFQRAVTLAAHLCACRENWLDRMVSGSASQVPWFDPAATLESLAPRFAAIEAKWVSYLGSLSDEGLDESFEFPAFTGDRMRWYVEGQVFQLVGHGAYHRGQVVLLVEQLGGETVDTDYLYWASKRSDRWGKVG